jgi:hypothetical protein
MLLPTGEFVLVLSEAPSVNADWAKEFKERSGAAAMLVTTEAVDVENALYDENAYRAGDVGEWKDLGYTNEGSLDSFFRPIHDDRRYAVTPGSVFMAPLDESHTFRADDFVRAHLEPQTIGITFDAQGDENLMRLLYGGAEFSPAGLVKSPGSAQEKLELGHYELTGCKRPQHIEVDSDGVAEVVSRDPENPATSGKRESPGTIGRFPDTGPQNHDVDLGEVTVGLSWEDDEPDPLAPGTPVEIIGPSYFGHLDGELAGQRGTVESNPHDNTPEGCVLVGGMTTDTYGSVKVFFPVGSLQPVPLDLQAVVRDARAALDEQLTLDDVVVLGIN